MNKGRLLSMVLSALLVIFGFASTKAQTGIENVRWELNELNGRKAANSRLYLEFDGSTGRISGSGGCNRFLVLTNSKRRGSRLSALAQLKWPVCGLERWKPRSISLTP